MGEKAEKDGGSLKAKKYEAVILDLERNEELARALLVMAGILSLLVAFPFYPLPITALIVGISGLLAYFRPPVGLIAGAILAFPAVAYQSPFFAIIYLVILGG
ncbi:MAG: hypothetical protein NT157_04750, partial [Candidatus Micrarchaeota archaeon]|nr:hypothetical protein [Candidatus Micrarchaeota archaeon]